MKYTIIFWSNGTRNAFLSSDETGIKEHVAWKLKIFPQIKIVERMATDILLEERKNP